MDIMTIISNAAGELIAPTTAAYVLAAIGLNIHFGMTGLMNMGQAGFMLLGAYGFAVTQSMGCNLFASVCAALALAVIYALLLGIPTLKLGPDYLAMVTLAAAEIIRIIGRSTAMTNLTGGSAGISPQDFTEKFEALSPLPDGSTTFLLWTYSNNIANSWWLRIVAWILVAIAAFLCWRWFHSPWGRMLKGIREDENAIRSLGKPVTKYKMESLILGGHAQYGSRNPDLLQPDRSPWLGDRRRRADVPGDLQATRLVGRPKGVGFPCLIQRILNSPPCRLSLSRASRSMI